MAGGNNASVSGYCSSPEWVEPYNGTCPKCGRHCYGMLPERTMFLKKFPTARCPVCNEEVEISEFEESAEDDEIVRMVFTDDDEEPRNVKKEEKEKRKKDLKYDFLDARIKLNEKMVAILQEMISLVEASVNSKSKKRRRATLRNEPLEPHEKNQPKRRRLH